MIHSPLIEIKDLKKHFKTPKGSLHAVDHVNLSIKRGKTLGVVGESGCGKSTLGRVLIGLEPQTGGTIFYNGKDITKLSKKESRQTHNKMQMIFQDPYASLNPRLTVGEIIADPLIVNKKYPKRAELNEKVIELMKLVGLDQRYHEIYPHEMDGGRRQRVGIARALALDPEFMICDEPVSSLDVSIQAQILNLLMDLQDERQLTYLFISHDLSVVKHIADEICVMYLGCIVETCPCEELFQNPLHPYTKALLSAIPTIDLRNQTKRIILKGELNSPINPPKSCRFAKRCFNAKDICFSKEPILKEISSMHFVSCHFA